MLRLHNAFREMGIVSGFYCIQEYEFDQEHRKDYLNEELRHYVRHTEHIKKMYWSNRRIRFRLWQLVQMVDVLWIFIKSLTKYDYFLYIFGRGLFFRNYYLSKIQQVEFWILKLLKKKVVVWCCGDDTRPPYCGCFDGDVKALKKATKQKAKIVRMQEKYALMIDFPASAHFHNRPYIKYPSIGVPVDKYEIVNMDQVVHSKIIILHAPSAQKWKGSTTVRQIIGHIKEKGLPIEYIEITDVPHNIVLQKIAQSDIVIDQVYSDTPMAGFATEASVNGVPVLVSGYYADYYQKEFSQPIPPNFFCSPGELEEKLIYLIQEEQVRKEFGASAQKFVLDNWMAHDVAKRIISLFDGTFPEEWMYDPQNSTYIWGAGNRKKWVIQKTVNLIENYGMDALCLPKNSELYRKYAKLYQKYKKGTRRNK